MILRSQAAFLRGGQRPLKLVDIAKNVGELRGNFQRLLIEFVRARLECSITLARMAISNPRVRSFRRLSNRALDGYLGTFALLDGISLGPSDVEIIDSRLAELAQLLKRLGDFN